MKERAAAIAVALFSLLATALAYRETSPIEIDFERGYEGAFVDGFYPRERAERKFYRWTDDASFLSLRNLPPEGRFTAEIRLKTVRPPGEPLPSLAFTANGVTVHRARAFPGDVVYPFEFPSTSSRLRLGIESETFEAAGGRKLGVQVLGIRMFHQDGAPSWVGPALWMALASLLLLAGGVLAGLSLPVSAGSALALTLAFEHLLRLDAVRFTTYPREVALLSAGAAAAALLLRAALNRAGWLHASDRARAASILTLLLLLKMAFLSFPLTLSSDADFQANRMRMLLQGNWYPTSVTQHEEPFRIPYPVSLYVTATPLAALGVELVPALEITTGIFDVLVSAILMFLAWRHLDDFRAGAIAAVLYQAVPMNALAFSAGNFTNLFAVAALTAALACFLASKALPSAFANLLALTAHFGMVLEGLVLWPVWLVLSRARGKRLTFAIAASFLLAALYYLGYLDLFRSQWDRALAAERASGTEASLRFLGEQLGWVFLAVAIAGSLSFIRRPLAGGLSRAAFGWLLVTLFFFGVDLTTAVEIRYWLQALPLLALFAGAYLSRVFDRGSMGRTAALAAVTYMVIVGLRTIYESMVFRYH